MSSCNADTLERGLVCDLSKPCVSEFFKQMTPKLTVVRHWANGDGSCFFHSLATSLCTAKNFHRMTYETQRKEGHKLRKKVLDAMALEWEPFWEAQRLLLERKFNEKISRNMIPEFNEFRSKISNTSEMSDQYIIMFALHVLKVRVFFYDRSRCSLFCGVTGTSQNTSKVAIILWCNTSGNLHFEPLVQRKGPIRRGEKYNSDRCFVYRGTLYQGNFDSKKDKIIQQLQKNYLSTCGTEWTSVI